VPAPGDLGLHHVVRHERVGHVSGPCSDWDREWHDVLGDLGGGNRRGNAKSVTRQGAGVVQKEVGTRKSRSNKVT